MEYWNDLRAANNDMQLIQLVMGVVSVIVIVRRFVRANQRVQEMRAIRGGVI